MENVTTNIQPNSTIVLEQGANKKFNSFTLIAMCMAVYFSVGRKLKNLRSLKFIAEENPALATVTGQTTNTKEITVTENGPKWRNVTNLNELVDYALDNVTDPTMSLLIRLASGKSSVSLTEVYQSFKADQWSSFINYIRFVISEHNEALGASFIQDYVAKVGKRDFDNGVLMLSIKAPNVTFTRAQIWAMETLLLQEYAINNNRPVLITFETATIVGLTTYFGNNNATSTFNDYATTQFHNVEKSYEDGDVTAQAWTCTGSVLYIGATLVPVEDRTSVLNKVIEDALSNVGEFQVTNPTILA